MIIDKKLDLDRQLEYFDDGGLAFAQNVVVSEDGLSIQNEPAIVNFVNNNNFDLVGFIACNEEFILFGKQSEIVRVSKAGSWNICTTNWQYQGGEVFGTFTYNVANELIIAVSERNLPEDVICPLKIINLDRDNYVAGSDDNIYTLTPDIPQSNMIDINYVLGDRIKKGKYNFFIKYYIEDKFETGWFPIGVPVFFYDNIGSATAKIIDREEIQAVGELNDEGTPETLGEYKMAYTDYYNNNDDYTNNNVILNLEINNPLFYTHYRIGYIVNTNTGVEAYQTYKQKIDTKRVLINTSREVISIDELTISYFNIYNVNTMCNYKDRLYLANYKEENRNKLVDTIDVSDITVSYDTSDRFVMYYDYAQLPYQWKTKPGRCAVYNFFIHYVYPNGNYTDGIRIDNNGRGNLSVFTNSKGERLFATPTTGSFNVKKLRFDGIKTYPQFVGYFISYEKPEYIQIGEGLLVPKTNNYRELVDDDGGVKKYKYHFAKDLFEVKTRYQTEFWKFYYPEFNIIGGKTNIVNLIETGDIGTANGTGNSNQFIANNLNYPTQNFVGSGTIYSIKNTEIIAPNDYDNLGKEGYLKLEFANYTDINQLESVKKFTAINKDTDLYLSDNKKLVSLGYIKYYTNPNTTNTYGYEEALYNYDFYRCYSSIPFFRGCGIIINQTESNHINAYSGTEYYPSEQPDVTEYIYSHVGVTSYWHETHYPLFLKEINQEPERVFYSYYKIKWKDDITGYGDLFMPFTSEQYQRQSIVLSPQYINDLYKLDPVYYDYTGKILVNYDDELYSNRLDVYNKTIRRSDIIQSESVVNSWKYFRPENYKIITEDKGAINNIVGIGNYLFAHCEHSLFLFDVTDSLQALDKNVQLLQPDSFEVAYKEVFTADKGYGGLQDYESWICDEFGYIFYDKSAKKIYRFDGGQLKDMTESIDNLIKEMKPEHIWFGNDRIRNRIIVNIRSADDNIILSYNLLSGGWISTHSYSSNYKFIGLKDKLFIPNVVGSELTITHYVDTEFNKFTLPVGNIDNDGSYKSFIDVVFTNKSYNKIKVLDFITYIINKEPADNFELLQLEIYTNCCYSGIIDISQERKKVSEYKKPYYDFERWNFNWFRNVIDKIENGDMVDRLSGRVHTYPQKVQRGYDNALMSGKYAVIRFSFKLMSKQVNIKDIHAYFKP